MDQDDRVLAGVGGWLAFFVFGIGIVAPLAQLWQLYALFSVRDQGFYALGDGWMLIELGEIVLTILSVGLCAIMAWRLISVRNWQSVEIAVAGIWASGIGVNLLEILLFRMAGAGGGAASQSFALDLVRNALVCGAWTAYFLRSQRVANTYPRDAEGGETADIFS